MLKNGNYKNTKKTETKRSKRSTLGSSKTVREVFCAWDNFWNHLYSTQLC